MKQIRCLSLLSAFAVLAAAPLVGQQGKGITREDPEQVGKTQPLVPTFVKVPMGVLAVVNDDGDQPLGTMRDQILDRRSGKVLFVAVAAAGSADAPAHLVPFERFRWNAEKQRLLLPMSAGELDSLPVYDPEQPTLLGGRDPATGAEPDPKRSPEGAQEAVMPLQHQAQLSASVVVGSRILAAHEPFASVSELVLEPTEGRIAFVLARKESASAADPYVVPWQAMTWEASEEKGSKEKGRFTVSIPSGELANAPALQRGDITLLGKRETLERIRDFYKSGTPSVRDMESGKSG